MCKYARPLVSARTALAVAVALVLAAAFAAAARGGQYHVYSCRTPSGQPAPTDGWSEGVHSGVDVTLNTCGEAGGGLIAGMNAHVSHQAATDKATWEFSAPVDELIYGATLWRAGEAVPLANPETAYMFWMAGVADAGSSTEVFDECGSKKCQREGDFSEPLSAENRVTVPGNALGSRYLYLNVSCGSLVSPCPSSEAGSTGYAATIELFAADLVLSDTESPLVSAVGGNLADAPTVSGHSDLAFQASDGGSGIYEVIFKVDGAVVSSVIPEEEGGHCRDVGGTSDGLPAFLYTQPCPTAVNVDLPFDTTALANGTHHLLVSVTDAAGNAKPVVDREVTVSNSATPAGGAGETSNGGGTGGSGTGSGGSGSGSGSGSGGAGGTGGGSGGGPSGSGVGSLGPAVGGSVGIGGAAATAAPNGVGASTQAILTAAWRAHKGERLTGPYGAARAVEGRLTNAGGAPIAGAQIAVDQLPAYAGARSRELAAPRTGADGRWRIALPRSIASSELRFSYRAHLGDALPVATRTLRLGVRAGVSLRIAPRIARSGGAIHFGGRLLGAPIPSGGKQVVLEARSPGGRWLEFHVIRGRAERGGWFGFDYRFRLPGPARYEFRVLCEAEADYPFAAGTSNVVRVYER